MLVSELGRSEADLLLDAAGDEAARVARQRALARLESLRDEALDVLEHSLRDEADPPARVAAAREVLDLIGVRVARPKSGSERGAPATGGERTEPGLRAVRRAQLRMRLGAAALILCVAGLALLTTLALDRALESPPEPTSKHAEQARKPAPAARPQPTVAAPAAQRALEPAPAPSVLPPQIPLVAPVQNVRAEPAGTVTPVRPRREPEPRPAPSAVSKRVPVPDVRPRPIAELASSSQPARGHAIVGRLGIRMDEADF
jgi:hypothetical protein